MRLALLASLALLVTARADLHVTVLHPLLGEIAREVGGDHVAVTSLLAPDGDPHHFEPKPDQIASAADSDLFLASGLGLETYLPTLRSVLPADVPVFIVGDELAVIEGGCNDPDHDHNHGAHHESDPHWWQSIDNVRRATTVIANRFAALDPTNADDFRTRANAYRRQLDSLERESRVRLARIPADRRILATTHAAFGYFCHDFGFEPVAVQGLSREQMPGANELASLIAWLREHHVTVIFPEKTSNPKILSAITRDTGIRLGTPLFADGTESATSYPAMIRHNVDAITAALAPPAAKRQ